MKIAFNPSTVAALTTPPNNKDITFDLKGRNIFARGVKFYGTDTNTWRDIKVNNVSIGSHTLDLRNGSNTTLTNTNGVVTINSTWRPVVDNLTSNSTTSSLSANQGRVLKALIDGKSNSGHTHDDRYLKLTGGTMASNALITFADSGSWNTNEGPQGARGGLYWTGQSDYAKLYAEETAKDNLDLVIQFGDDNSNGLSIRNKSNVQTSYISAGGVITTGTFKGNLDWSYITNKPATATRWPSWAEVTGKPSSFTPSTHSHGLSNSVFFLNMPNISGNATWKEAFGYPVNYNLLLSVRINSPAPEWCVGNFGSGILYGGSDTKGFMSSAYDAPLIMWAGGNGSSNDSVPKWYIGIRGTHKSIYNLTTIASEANAAYNLRHSHANKSVLDGITSGLVNNWNTAYTFVNTITGTDTDKVINKWDEIVNFLAGITEDNKLNTLLNSKLSVYELADKTNVGTIKNNGIYYSTTDASSGTLTNSPFNNGFTLINMTSYDGGDDLRRSRLAFNAYGEIKVSDDRGQANTAETWYNVLTSKNSGISGSTIKLNGTSITVYSSGTADGRYVKKSGDTMTGALNFANGTWNKVGDDSYMGDCNVSGHIGIKAANTTYPGVAFFNNSGTHLGNLTAYSGNIKYGAYSLQFLDNGNTSVNASTWTNPFSAYNSNAVADGQAICVWGQGSSLSNLSSDGGNIALYLRRISASTATLNMVLDGEYYANGNQRLAHVSEIPTSLKNPHALTISLNGTSQGPYDGSVAKNINITPSSIGAATSGHNHDDRYLRLTGGTMLLGEGLKFHADNNYFGTNADARIISLLNGNDKICDGGLIIDERATLDGKEYVTELLRIRDSEFKWRGSNILHSGNSHINGSTITINGSSLTISKSDHVHDYLVVNRASESTLNSAYHNFQVLYAGGGNGITGRPPGIDAFGLFKFRVATGWSGQILLANGGSLYIRSSEDAKMTSTLAWKTILDSSNYSSILDSRYYTESEVNSLLDAKLNRQNLSYGTWNPRGYNLAADYHYNGGDLSISENGGKMYVSIDGQFYQNEGQYRVLDTSDIGSIRGSLTLYQYLSSTDTNWFPLIWGGNDHKNTNNSTGSLYKSYDKLSWQTSSQTLYATKLRTTNLDTQTAIFHPDNDSTLKIYSGKTQDAVSDGHIGLQTSIDNTDGQTHVYPTQYGSRCVLALQPRGGSVYIGNMPNGGNGRKLNVNGDIGLFNTGSIRDLVIGGGIYWNPNVESASDNSDAASITLVRSGVAGGTTLVLSQMNDANDTIQFKTSTAARLYHNSNQILTSGDTKISGNTITINGSSLTVSKSDHNHDNRYVWKWNGVYGSANKFLKLAISNEKGWIRLEVSDSNNSLTAGYGIYMVGWSYHGDDNADTLFARCLYANDSRYTTALKVVRTSRNNYDFYFQFASGSSYPSYTINYSSSIISIDCTVTAIATIPTATWTSSLSALQLNASQVDWSGIQNKPSTFTPAAHTHTVFKNNLMIKGTNGVSDSASIHLGIGDSDTGFKWISDGVCQMYANNVAIGQWTSGGMNWFKNPTVNGNKVWNAGNDGSGSGLDADTVDGYHATDGRTFNGNINWGSWNDTWSDGTNKHPWYGFDHRYPNTGAYSTTITDFFGMTIKTNNTLRLDFGTLLLNGIDIHNINVASASKLQTARRLWGQSFDGTADISGTLSGVAHIQFSADNSYSIGTTTSEAAHTYTRQVWARHLNASRVYTGDTNLYIGYNNTAQVKFYSGTKQSGDGSNERMTISTNGNIGIGTTSPAYKLHVAGDIYTTTGFNKSGSSNSYILLGGGSHKAISDFMLKTDELSNNLTTISKSLTVTQAWMDTGIKNTDLPANGTYIIQVSANNTSDYMQSNYWSGIMSWYKDGTNDSETDEIILHRAGHAYHHTIYLRTIMTTSSDGRHLRLQIAADTNLSTAVTYTFKFKRVI